MLITSRFIAVVVGEDVVPPTCIVPSTTPRAVLTEAMEDVVAMSFSVATATTGRCSTCAMNVMFRLGMVRTGHTTRVLANKDRTP